MGKTRSGTPRYRCKDCQKTWSLDKQVGRPYEGGKEKTGYQKFKEGNELSKRTFVESCLSHVCCKSFSDWVFTLPAPVDNHLYDLAQISHF